ncbi:hypothetical protein DH2020_001712 [Rehmannia glutinosa]|uniref:Uncharacterized protein n=1 Tax=Rehmannia glutinosa TaxID=99300 RepID=A0ABR0XRQ3_REHGL
MERLSDDLLALILDKFEDPIDRKSFSQVCKNWLRVEGLHRSTLQVFEPDLIPNFLPRFPNLLKFQASTPIRNSLIQFLANTCPRIQVLNLNYKETWDLRCEIVGEDDFDDEGLCDIARGRVSDEALESIGGLKYLEVLNLQGCWLITDMGLAFLAKGYLCNTLRILNIAECDQITDCGLIYLMEMACLEELNLEACRLSVTDIGIEMAVATFSTLKKLNLSWLFNVSDVAMAALARGCLNLEELIWKNYDFAITGHDLENLVLGCSTLERIVLHKRFRVWVPMAVEERILRRNCVLEWVDG